MKIFFYGLFMDKQLLIAKGLGPGEDRVGYVDGFSLRIGQRATLIRQPQGRAYGVVMTISAPEAAGLYAEDSVSDYRPEAVKAQLDMGDVVECTCYNLPGDKITGANIAYANSLLELATELGFPSVYLNEIKRFAR